MKGCIAICEIEVKMIHDEMNWTVFDFFKFYLKKYTHDVTAGWYCYKLIEGIYYFYWCDTEDTPKERYLEALKRDGWEVSMSSIVITDAFN